MHERTSRDSTPSHALANGDNLLLGHSAAMRTLRERIQRAAGFPWPIRLEGPRGSGKNRAAELFHAASGRAGAIVRCGLNKVSAIEGSEIGQLVGWVRGAFTGALYDYRGAFERAHRGTLFLNEVHLASTRVQEILLDLLDGKRFQRLGQQVDTEVDVRIVFATNEDLSALAHAGRFRWDLLDRMEDDVIQMPALSEHIEDIPEIAAAIMVKLAQEANVEADILSPLEIDRLMGFGWPGNVRQLENALKWRIKYRKMPDYLPRTRRWTLGSNDALQRALTEAHGNKSAAARALGTSRKTLYAHLKRQQRELLNDSTT